MSSLAARFELSTPPENSPSVWRGVVGVCTIALTTIGGAFAALRALLVMATTLTGTVKDLAEKVAQLEYQIAAKDAQIEDNKKQIEKLASQIKSEEDLLASLRTQNTNQEGRIKSLEDELALTRAQLLAKTTDYNALLEERNSLQASLTAEMAKNRTV